MQVELVGKAGVVGRTRRKLCNFCLNLLNQVEPFLFQIKKVRDTSYRDSVNLNISKKVGVRINKNFHGSIQT